MYAARYTSIDTFYENYVTSSSNSRRKRTFNAGVAVGRFQNNSAIWKRFITERHSLGNLKADVVTMAQLPTHTQ